MTRSRRRLMRPRTGLLVVAAAVALGALTGAYVLPEPGVVLAALRPPSVVDPADPTGPGTPSRTPSAGTATASSSPTTGSGRVTERHLVPVSAFAKAGLQVTVYPMNGATDPRGAVTECTEDREVGARTLGDLTGRDPAVTGNWDAADGTALEVLATAENADLAEVYVKRLAAAQTLCQDEPAGHFVYGPVHTEQVPAGSSARWVGRWDEKQNTTGGVPADTGPCGGVVLAANGTHFAILEVFMCADSDGMATLARAAAKQLG